jgi:hypothetical protein
VRRFAKAKEAGCKWEPVVVEVVVAAEVVVARAVSLFLN